MVAEQQRIDRAPFEPPFQVASSESPSCVDKDVVHIPRSDLVSRGRQAAEDKLD
jgi:hypothetical protein